MFDKIHCYYLHRKAEFLMFLQQVTQTYACFWVKVLEKAPPPSTPYSLLLSRLTHKSQLPWCAPTASERTKPQSNTQRISHRTRRKPYFSMVLFPLVCMFLFLLCEAFLQIYSSPTFTFQLDAHALRLFNPCAIKYLKVISERNSLSIV